MFSIDGVEYNVKCTVERAAEIKESDIGGLLVNGHIFRDVLGTYMSYTISLEMPLRNRERYAGLIEQLTEPVEGHAFTVPYNNGTLQVTGKVDKPSDIWEKLESGYTFWKGLRFTIAANGPTKELELGEVIARGMSPLPDVSGPREGDIYIYTNGAWEPYTAPSYADADSTEY